MSGLQTHSNVCNTGTIGPEAVRMARFLCSEQVRQQSVAHRAWVSSAVHTVCRQPMQEFQVRQTTYALVTNSETRSLETLS